MTIDIPIALEECLMIWRKCCAALVRWRKWNIQRIFFFLLFSSIRHFLSRQSAIFTIVSVHFILYISANYSFMQNFAKAMALSMVCRFPCVLHMNISRQRKKRRIKTTERTFNVRLDKLIQFFENTFFRLHCGWI